MATVSLCMIVRNEEKVLTRCMDSVRGIADEICITDTGSTDKTREIAAQYGTVQVFPWCDDFSAARNFSFAQARMDYTLWLDADDVLLPSDRQKLLAPKRSWTAQPMSSCCRTTPVLMSRADRLFLLP